ncbi:MAG: cupredoxin domain-containing protein [Chloroflexia bacterium]|nr:cupredoxin domain-containing protein [Chloroflexia bacterium]
MLRVRVLIRSAVAVVALLLLAGPAVAGNWATVRLDAPPGEVIAGEPWRFGFLVKQHDIRPTNDVEPFVLARHQATGEEVRAEARQDGAVGHFVAELLFPVAGSWKWAITPKPFPETSTETLTVLGKPAVVANDAAPLAARIRRGTCDAGGAAAFQLAGLPPAAAVVEAAMPFEAPGGVAVRAVASGSSTVAAPLADLVGGDYAIEVEGRAGEPAGAVCGEIAGRVVADDLVVGLRPGMGTEGIGVARLRGTGGETTVELYLLDTAAPMPPAKGEPAAAETAVVEIVDPMAFAPFRLTMAAGTEVVWTNTSGIVHTITGDDLAFADSALLEPGQSFSQVFAEPGRYEYRCGPHPDMIGEIVVE